MGTEALGREDSNLFEWQGSSDLDDYVRATYYVETLAQPDLTAIAMARVSRLERRFRFTWLWYDLLPQVWTNSGL